MYQGKKIAQAAIDYLVLLICISLNWIGFLIGGFLYYRETYLVSKSESFSSPLEKVTPVLGNPPAFTD